MTVKYKSEMLVYGRRNISRLGYGFVGRFQNKIRKKIKIFDFYFETYHLGWVSRNKVTKGHLRSLGQVSHQ